MPTSGFNMNHIGHLIPVPNTAAPTLIGMPGFTLSNCTQTARTISLSPDPYFLVPRTAYVANGSGSNYLMTMRHTAATLCVVGSNNYSNGFVFQCLFGIGDNAHYSTSRMFLGLTATTSALSNVDPATMTDCIGIGHNSGDTTFKLYSGGSTPNTVIDTGIPRNSAQRDMVQLTIMCSGVTTYPGGPTKLVHWCARGSGYNKRGYIKTDDAATFPVSGTLLNSFNAFRTPGSGGGTVAIDIFGAKWKIGSTY